MVQVRSANSAPKESKAVANNASKVKTEDKSKEKDSLQPQIEKEDETKEKEGQKLDQENKGEEGGGPPSSSSGPEQGDSSLQPAGKPKKSEKGKESAEKKDGEQEEKEEKKDPKEKPKSGAMSPPSAPGGDGEEKKAAGAALVEEINKKLPNVKKDLDKASANVCGEAESKTEVLANNEKKHDSASDKRNQMDEAVVPPTEEGQAMGNAGQVESLEKKGERTAKPDGKEAKTELQKQIDKSVPTKMGQLNDFKKKDKAKAIGRKVTGEVTKDVKAVDETYNEIEQQPKPVPSKKLVKPLPEIEMAPPTPELDLGKGAVPGLDSAHTDFQAFEKGTDDVMSKEGISDEELKMVDSGPLLEARNERDGIKKKVKDEPAKIKQYAAGKKDGVKKDMKQEEKQARGNMERKRKQKLDETKKKQQGTKSAIEKKREKVTNHIKGIYEQAQKNIKSKLDSLEKESMRRFDIAQKQYSKEFEDEVNRDINAWKRKRYSGWFGGFKKAKDWFLGIDDFPEVKAAFKRAKDNYVSKIDKLIVAITKDNEKVINECKKELKSARIKIKKYVATLGPDVKKAGLAAMKDMQKKLNELDSFIDKKKEELAKKLCEKKDQAIEKINKKIEKMKEAMSGALSKLVGFLLDAMLKFFKWVLGKFGMDQGALMKVIDKGMRTIKQIVLHPIDFIMNLVRGVGQGIKNFGANIKKHLIAGVIEWLTGSLGGVGITLPETWDMKGILSLLLQILGLTWESIRAKLVKHLGEEKVAAAEKTVDVIKRLVTEGPMALWDMLVEKAAEIKQTVMDGIRNWVITNIVKQGIIALGSFLTPAGAIIQAIKTIYNVVMWFIDNWDRIVTFVKTVFSAISDIAFGRLGAVAGAVERGIAMIIPMILDFMAKLLNLGGITKAIKNVIKKARKPIDKVLDKLIKFVTKKMKAVFGAGKKAIKSGVKKGKEAIKKFVEWWKIKKSFKNKSGETHTLYFTGKGGAAKLMMRSSPKKIEAYVKELEKAAEPKDKKTIEAIKSHIANINKHQKGPNSKRMLLEKKSINPSK